MDPDITRPEEDPKSGSSRASLTGGRTSTTANGRAIARPQKRPRLLEAKEINLKGAGTNFFFFFFLYAFPPLVRGLFQAAFGHRADGKFLELVV